MKRARERSRESREMRMTQTGNRHLCITRPRPASRDTRQKQDHAAGSGGGDPTGRRVATRCIFLRPSFIPRGASARRLIPRARASPREDRVLELSGKEIISDDSA